MSLGRLLQTASLAIALGLPAGLAAAQVNLSKQHDSDQPIEISADSLEVQQDQQIATFRGNVDAVQGDIRLRADQLKVHYRNKSAAATDAGKATAKPADKPAAKSTKGAKPGGQVGDATMGSSISRIDAIGKVFISSPDETAQGDTGVYDLDKHTIVLEGQPVVLTRGPNVLRGQRAVMNLDTGRSVMETAPGGRVKGLFVPQKKQPTK